MQEHKLLWVGVRALRSEHGVLCWMWASSRPGSALPALQAVQQGDIRAVLHSPPGLEAVAKVDVQQLAAVPVQHEIGGVAVAQAQQIANLQQQHHIDYMLKTAALRSWQHEIGGATIAQGQPVAKLQQQNDSSAAAATWHQLDADDCGISFMAASAGCAWEGGAQGARAVDAKIISAACGGMTGGAGV